MNIRYWIFIYIFNNFNNYFFIWIDYFVEKNIYLYLSIFQKNTIIFIQIYVYIYIVFIKLAVIEIKMDIFDDFIGLEIWDIFLNLIWFFYIGNWGNWNLIAKNIFQFIELIIANFFLFKLKISKNGFYLDQNIDKIYKKKYRIGKFDDILI